MNDIRLLVLDYLSSWAIKAYVPNVKELKYGMK